MAPAETFEHVLIKSRENADGGAFGQVSLMSNKKVI